MLFNVLKPFAVLLNVNNVCYNVFDNQDDTKLEGEKESGEDGEDDSADVEGRDIDR